MADITKVRAEANMVKECLDKEFQKRINSLTTFEINELVSILEKTGINRDEVSALKTEIMQATNKNQTIARILDTPGALCEQVKDIVNKIKQ
ncbi:MAG: hypothetical protein LUC96_06535 [Alistipes sp.]|uniref:hypothetical protein n=1 Tax=Alistipes sp. TaxID=1872444 RepID=UPI0025BA9B3A|nr:hypothetical protein [Alistipes sp.]MCD7795505.1 hypothetical protein [Alistipes sp.]MCD8274624.1 hypothetical protein [Alistipes sp.]